MMNQKFVFEFSSQLHIPKARTMAAVPGALLVAVPQQAQAAVV